MTDKPEDQIKVVKGRIKVDMPGNKVGSFVLSALLNLMFWAKRMELKAKQPHLPDGERFWLALRATMNDYVKAYLATREKEFDDVDQAGS